MDVRPRSDSMEFCGIGQRQFRLSTPMSLTNKAAAQSDIHTAWISRWLLFNHCLRRDGCRERSGSVVECSTRDGGAAGLSLTGATAL